MESKGIINSKIKAGKYATVIGTLVQNGMSKEEAEALVESILTSLGESHANEELILEKLDELAERVNGLRNAAVTTNTPATTAEIKHTDDRGIPIVTCDPYEPASEWFVVQNSPTLNNYDKNEFEIEGTVLKKYKGNKTEVQIPYGVTEIRSGSVFASVFSNSSSLTSVIIPKSVTKIGVCAFNSCYSLTSVIIPDSVIEIESGAFWYCKSLVNINLPNSVEKIGSSAFSECSSLASINIPDSVIEIDDMAFSGCCSLTSVNIPVSVERIGNCTFAHCSALKSIFIPAYTEINKNAFWYCRSLESITVDKDNEEYKSVNNCLLTDDGETLIRGCKNSVIPDSVRVIGDGAFSGSSLTSIVIPDSVTEIGYGAFSGCKFLKKVVIPDGFTEIADATFEMCEALESIVIPYSVEYIGEEAFWGCISLKSIFISENVTDIGRDAFAYCDSLESIVVDKHNGFYKSENNCLLTKDGKKALCVWGNSIIPDTVTELEAAVFGRESFENVKVSKHNKFYKSEGGCLLTKDGKKLLYGGRNSVIPLSVTEIGDEAFVECDSLTSIIIPNNVTVIGDNAFLCDSLTEVTMPAKFRYDLERIFGLGYEKISFTWLK